MIKAGRGRSYLLGAVLVLVAGCASPATKPSPTAVPATGTEESIATPTVIPVSPTPTSLPTQIPTATLAPIGEIQPIPVGYVYLGDTKTMALGFNFEAGGAIGSLLYHGTEMVDDADYGRYFQFSPYDGSDQYVCDSSSCFVTWGWNPLQAGSADGTGAPVQEYRRSEDGIYIKALGQEWGHSKGVSDVIYETWAWDRGSYFEVHIRMTHTGQDTHTLADAESPAAYFGAALPIEYGYTGTEPFSAEEIQQYHMVTGDMSNNTNPPVFPSENWMAFGDQQGKGLILAVPTQPKLSGQWSMVFIQYAYPSPIGYLSPFAHFETSPGFAFDLTYYLIPGPIHDNRSIVYDLIPHTTWTFDLNSTEGWTSSSRLIEAQTGVVSASLSPDEPLTSTPALNFYGLQFPAIDISAQTMAENTELCLNFTTLTAWDWNPARALCQPMLPGEFTGYQFDLSTDPAWTNGLITQIQITTSTQVVLDIDEIRVKRVSFGWEFGNPPEPDGWVAWNQIAPLEVKDGHLFSTSKGTDPYMGSPFLNLAAKEFDKIEIRMRTTAGSDAQIFFVTDKDRGWDEAKSKHFSIMSDGDFHTYIIDMSSIAVWQDQIQQIRLDPMVAPGDFELDYIRIIEP